MDHNISVIEQNLGVVEDWDAFEEIWKSAFHQRLRIDPTEHPLLCTEPAWNPTEKREKLAELAFETFNFPAFYVAKDAVMSALVSTMLQWYFHGNRYHC
jgi:actin-like protein 6A